MAKSEPPGRLHSSTGSPYERQAICFRKSPPRRLVRIAPRPFPSQVERSLGPTLAGHAFVAASIYASRLPGLAYEPLYFTFSPSSAAAILWSVRNPWIIQADPEPPGRRPPDPRLPTPSDLSVTGGPFVSSGGVGLSRLAPIYGRPLSSSRNPKL